MAITVLQSPDEWTPAYNDQWVLASSTEIAQPNFKYKIETSITYDLNGTPTTVTFTDYYLPRPDGLMLHDPKEKVKNYIKHFWKPGEFNIIEAVNCRVGVGVSIIETWDDETLPDTQTIDYVAWNASLTERQMFLDNYAYEDYISNTNPKIHYINNDLNRPARTVTMTSDVFVHFVYRDVFAKIQYEVYLSDGATLVGVEEYSLASVVQGYVYQVNISPKAAVDFSISIAAGYVVKLVFYDSEDDEIVSYQYTVGSYCTKHEGKSIYYLNRVGGISFMNFQMMSNVSAGIQTNEVRLNRNEVIDNTYTYLPYKHENNTVSTQEKITEILNTDWITKQQSSDLEELFSSPLKWLVSDEDDYDDPYKFKPVTIIDRRYEFKKHENEKLFNLSITVEYSTQETRQRGI